VSERGDDYDDLSQGQKANRQGREILDVVRAALGDFAFVRVRLAQKNAAAVAELAGHLGYLLPPAPPGIFAEQAVICRNIFGDPHAVDFLLFAPGWPSALALMVRHQQNSGSVKEKLSYWVELFTEHYPCPALLLAEGPRLVGDRAFMRVAREKVARSGGRFLRVFAGQYEFRQWLLAGFAYPTSEGGVLAL